MAEQRRRIKTAWVATQFPTTVPACTPARAELMLQPCLLHLRAPQWSDSCHNWEGSAVGGRGYSDLGSVWAQHDGQCWCLPRKLIRSNPNLCHWPDFTACILIHIKRPGGLCLPCGIALQHYRVSGDCGGVCGCRGKWRHRCSGGCHRRQQIGGSIKLCGQPAEAHAPSWAQSLHGRCWCSTALLGQGCQVMKDERAHTLRKQIQLIINIQGFRSLNLGSNPTHNRAERDNE